MILVINLNASVDKRYKMKDLIKGEVMRAAEVDNTPGGKGIALESLDVFKMAAGDLIEITPADATNYATSDYLGIEASKFTLKPLSVAPEAGFYMKKIRTTTYHGDDNGSFVKKQIPSYVYEVKVN